MKLMLEMTRGKAEKLKGKSKTNDKKRSGGLEITRQIEGPSRIRISGKPYFESLGCQGAKRQGKNITRQIIPDPLNP
jgi:hypothetical protein